ncbi:MAG: hypothetical protein IKZ50_01355 [Bacteroidales bacterium]|nr:hypothetical protein [Bacteroidales bacterium]MBR5907023.1 hypothetical protein [Bacteroidales bacterium]
MENFAGTQAQVAWLLLFAGTEELFEESVESDYSRMLEGMEAADLLALIEQAQKRLKTIAIENSLNLTKLFIDKSYDVHLQSAEGQAIPFRPLVKALFILFLRHPEGILLKHRDLFTDELERIYAVISPNVAAEDRHRRVQRLMSLESNAYSENASTLNATLDRIMPPGTAEEYKIQGNNGFPRKIHLSPLLVQWELR